jgi:hypothetical protein
LVQVCHPSPPKLKKTDWLESTELIASTRANTVQMT